jgi:hypothetical protein
LAVALNHSDQTERNAALAQLDALQAELSKLQAELNAYGQCDPVQAEMKRSAIELAREAALRWTGERPIVFRFHPQNGRHG